MSPTTAGMSSALWMEAAILSQATVMILGARRCRHLRTLLWPGSRLDMRDYVYDTETQLYYLQARYYDPETARFISRDPDGGDQTNPLSQNLYAYGNGFHL